MRWRTWVVLALAAAGLAAQSGRSPAALRSARVYIGPMADNFDILLGTALKAKKVPLTTVTAASGADYVLEAAPTQANETSRSKLMPLLSSTESVAMVELRLVDTVLGGVKWSYAVNLAAKPDASPQEKARMRSEAATEVAQHLKDFIDKQPKKK